MPGSATRRTGWRQPSRDAPGRGYNVTISAPHMHAMCLDLLHDFLRPGCRALDVGSGSGYLTVCMALMCGEAHGIEYVPQLVPPRGGSGGLRLICRTTIPLWAMCMCASE